MVAYLCDSCVHKVVCQATSDGLCKGDCALYTKVENFNSPQQLMAEIAALGVQLDIAIKDRDFANMLDVLSQLRQLSAV
jgi:hypothetical protein